MSKSKASKPGLASYLYADFKLSLKTIIKEKDTEGLKKILREDRTCLEYIRKPTFWISSLASAIYDTPVHQAISDPDLLKIFLNAGANPNAVMVDTRGNFQSLLFLAATKNLSSGPKVVHLLLTSGADVEKISWQGTVYGTALDAARARDAKVITYLLLQAKDVKAKKQLDSSRESAYRQRVDLEVSRITEHFNSLTLQLGLQMSEFSNQLDNLAQTSLGPLVANDEKAERSLRDILDGRRRLQENIDSLQRRIETFQPSAPPADEARRPSAQSGGSDQQAAFAPSGGQDSFLQDLPPRYEDIHGNMDRED